MSEVSPELELKLEPLKRSVPRTLRHRPETGGRHVHLVVHLIPFRFLLPGGSLWSCRSLHLECRSNGFQLRQTLGVDLFDPTR